MVYLTPIFELRPHKIKTFCVSVRIEEVLLDDYFNNNMEIGIVFVDRKTHPLFNNDKKNTEVDSAAYYNSGNRIFVTPDDIYVSL